MGRPERAGPPVSVEAISSALNLGPVPRDRGAKRIPPARRCWWVYVQARRYTDRHVGRLDIQAFVGAFRGAQASPRNVHHHVSFNSDARDYAERVNACLVLIDDPELAALMIEHGCGVIVEESFALKQVDENFFEEE